MRLNVGTDAVCLLRENWSLVLRIALINLLGSGCGGLIWRRLIEEIGD